MTRAWRADFRVDAGEVVYLGEYFLTSACGASNSGAFRDASARDLGLLGQKNAALAQSSIKRRVLAATGEVSF